MILVELKTSMFSIAKRAIPKNLPCCCSMDFRVAATCTAI